MTREEAIKFYADEILLLELAPTINGDNGSGMREEWKRQAEIHRMAIASLREQEHKRYTRHEVACIIAELFGDDCACNFNGIDEWLPLKCELLDACPYPVGVACWEQYLKHKEDT